MRKTVSALLVSTLVLSACGAVRESRINPFNWFGNSRSEPIAAQDARSVNPLIPTRSGLFSRKPSDQEEYLGSPVETVTDLVVERVPGGAIVRATGVARLQGVYSVQLTPLTEDETPIDGVLTYWLEGIPAPGVQAQGPAVTREATVGRKLTDQQLSGVRVIRVQGNQNARTSRR